MITSDHGQGLDDHLSVPGSVTHGNLLYESELRVPLIFHHPDDPQGRFAPRRIKTRVSLLDLMPTILDLAGLSAPKGAVGRSLFAMMKGEGGSADLRGVVVAETNWRNVDKIAVYSDEWKYIENRDGWEGVNPYELQPMGIKEEGKLTDRIHDEIEISEKMQESLVAWERAFPRAGNTAPSHAVTEREIDQLKSLGYLK